MVLILTRYLCQFGRVTIPQIGTIELRQASPVLDVAAKHLMPPQYEVALSTNEFITEHQHQWLMASAGGHIHEADLSSFGSRLKARIVDQPYNWNGVGRFSFAQGAIILDTLNSASSQLKPVPAQKVLRDNPQHQMLVGDRQMSSDQVSDALARKTGRRPLNIVIGWIAFFAALVAILLYLYLHQFRVASSGLQLPFSFF